MTVDVHCPWNSTHKAISVSIQVKQLDTAIHKLRSHQTDGIWITDTEASTTPFVQCSLTNLIFLTNGKNWWTQAACDINSKLRMQYAHSPWLHSFLWSLWVVAMIYWIWHSPKILLVSQYLVKTHGRYWLFWDTKAQNALNSPTITIRQTVEENDINVFTEHFVAFSVKIA